MSAALSHKRTSRLSRFYYGSPYYPEHWDENLRQGDPALMAAAGWNMVRMAEFAWDLMEPRPGQYDFSLFDITIERMAAQNIVTMLCTPTATPPRWLTAAHPEMLGAREDGTPLQHGARQQACYASPVLREHSRRITRVMAEHYRDNRHVIAWQTDNEINCQFPECHCGNCQAAFREFLRERYNDNIASLNTAWGANFWAQTYSDFHQIETPKYDRPTHPNPSHVLDYHRYLSWRAARFQHDQVEILREVNPNWWITHNGLFRHIDYRGQFTQDLDVLGYDVYPFFNFNHVSRPASQSFNLDQARAWSGNFIIPEQQSGPGGQGGYFHDTPEPGEMRRMAYLSIARGADSLLFFRWRTARYGAEEYWCGVLEHDSIPRRRYTEAARLGQELKQVGPAVLGTRVHVDVAIAAADQEVSDAHLPISMGLPAPDAMARETHAFFLNQGYAAGLVHPSDDLSGISVYVIPHWAVFSPAWVAPLTDWVQKGGLLVIGARTATKDLNNHVVPHTPPGLLTSLSGVTVEEYGHQNAPAERPLHIALPAGQVHSQHWYELLQPTRPNGAEVLGTWQSRHLWGAPAVTIHKLGAGHVLYVGTYLTAELWKVLLPEITKRSSLQPLWPGASGTLQVVRRESDTHQVWFFLNNGEEPALLETLPAGAVNLFTGQAAAAPLELQPNEVVVLQTPA